MSKINNFNASVGFADTKPHYILLDGLRGVAALMVLWYHVFEGFAFAKGSVIETFNHGHLGVDFFFLLSGFVISYAYDDRWFNDKSLKSNGKDELKVTFLNGKENIIVYSLFTITFLSIVIFSNSVIATKLDYITSAAGLIAMMLTSLKKVENWIFYLFADIVLIPLCIYNGLYLTSLQYVAYTILAIMGLISWSKEARQNV